ncbi:MAG TPA: sugar phosphate isomerase/epimerase [Verrucomicrobiae bacterium]|nr:sugar phosphate isomerase/epimerase [Verrucomicrobiae bacterium]
MKINQVAAQLYTVRDFCKTPADIAASLKKIRAIGYQAVQLSGLGPIAETELTRMLTRERLTCCATHEPSEEILNEPERVVAHLQKLGCHLTAYAWPAGIKFDTLADVTAFAARLNAAGKALHDAGMVLCYHNHHIEFRRVGGRVVLEILFAETDPRYLQGEPDTYWVQHGGGDPVEWCARLKNRLPIIHLKDYIVTAENKPTFAEIGNGNLNWKKIIPAAEAAGCQWFCVEQDTCPGDPFDSLKQSFDYIKANLCSS